MVITDRGISLIKEFEGVRLKAYRCPANVLTIGYGHTGPDVKEGMVITQEQADRFLKKDIRWVEDTVTKGIGRTPTTQNQFDAMCSLTFNIGGKRFLGSTLLRHHVAGDYAAAADDFASWRMGGGKVIPGLVRRREAEKKLYSELSLAFIQPWNLEGYVDNEADLS